MDGAGRELTRPPLAEPSAVFVGLVGGMLVGTIGLGASGPFAGWVGAGIGLALIGAGIALHRAAAAAFRRAGTTIETLDVPSGLVESGPFSRTRNPMYLGGVLILFGWALLLGRLELLAVPVLWMPLAASLWIRPEERLLADRFGEGWASYRSRVRRWI